MKRNYIQALLLSGALVAMCGCDDNAWNDRLDGFDGNPEITDVKTIEYTLTDADYALIASNATNKAMAEAAGLADELKAVGTQHYFTDKIQAKDYAPALLASSSFPYFTLSDKSAIKLTYNVGVGLPEELKSLAEATEYVVTDDDYIYAWGSDENYIDAFAPSVSPTKYIPMYLADRFDDAVAGDYVIVNYEYSEQEPVFGNVGGGDEPTPAFTPSSVISSITLGAVVDINAIVTAKSTNGMIVTDNSGSVFMYYGNSFDYDAYSIGDQVVINAEVGAYNKGFQLTGSSAVVEVVGHQDYTYPAPKVYTGADLDQAITRTDNEIAIYGRITGTVAVSGNNINIIVEGAETAKGGAYYAPDALKEKLVDGANVTLTGYFIAIAGGRYCNFVVTDVAAAMAKAPVAPVATTNTNAVYYFNGSRWAVAANVAILQPADYKEMGQTYGNLSNNLPAELLPIYLSKNFPYAQADDTKYVMYKYYANSVTSYRCDQYVYDGAQWRLNKGVEAETSQFVRNDNKWNYDPSVTITLPAGKGIAVSTLYYQACVDWVFEKICVPMGSTGIKSGMYYVTSYGNNEYYSGTSAYQGNVDLRAAAARQQYEEGFAGMSDDEVVELMKQRFAYQVMPGALSALHPDAVPVAGIDVLYTINFAVYTGATAEYTIVYKVTAPAQFEFVSCSWWEGGQPAQKLDL